MIHFAQGTKPFLFEKLASPDENGVSRWVSKSEFENYKIMNDYCSP
ncbi:hypothetical protein [Ruminococcus sp.]